MCCRTKKKTSGLCRITAKRFVYANSICFDENLVNAWLNEFRVIVNSRYYVNPLNIIGSLENPIIWTAVTCSACFPTDSFKWRSLCSAEREREREREICTKIGQWLCDVILDIDRARNVQTIETISSTETILETKLLLRATENLISQILVIWLQLLQLLITRRPHAFENQCYRKGLLLFKKRNKFLRLPEEFFF